MFPGRCQYKDRYGQCALYEGHPGEHKSEALLKRESYEEAHPSLSAIRRVVRQEIREALQERAAARLPESGNIKQGSD